MDKKNNEINSESLDQVTGGMASPIYTAYGDEKGNLINPDTGNPFANESEAWDYFRNNHNRSTGMPGENGTGRRKGKFRFDV